MIPRPDLSASYGNTERLHGVRMRVTDAHGRAEEMDRWYGAAWRQKRKTIAHAFPAGTAKGGPAAVDALTEPSSKTEIRPALAEAAPSLN